MIDQRAEVTAQSDWTVGRLKEEVEKKFPGKIPASLQRLFKGTQLLPSSATLEEVSEASPMFGAFCLPCCRFMSRIFFPCTVRREPGRDGKIVSDHRQDGNDEVHRL